MCSPRPRVDEVDEMMTQRKQMLPPAESVYVAEQGYRGAHFDHFMNFFDGVRNGTPVAEDATFGLRAAARPWPATTATSKSGS